MADKKIMWNKQSYEEKEKLLDELAGTCCLGISKTTHAFTFSVKHGILHVLPKDMHEITDKGVYPANLIIWPRHGLRYINFNKHFNLIITEAKHSSFGHKRWESCVNANTGALARFPLKSGRNLTISAELNYQASGVLLNCYANITDSMGIGRPLLESSILLQSDTLAIEMMEVLIKKACVKDQVLAFDKTVE